MSSIVATLANNNGALETAINKAVPLTYAALSHHRLGRRYGSRSISTVSQPRFMPNQSPISPPSAAISNVSRHFSTHLNLDPYQRFITRIGFNCGIRLVRHEEAFVIERLGKFYKVLEAGMHVLLPFADRIAYVHSLKEQTIEIPPRLVITSDNLSIRVNGILFVKVIDAQKASYSIDNVMYAVTHLAQAVMSSAIGTMPLDKAYKERETLNANIVASINDFASQWGLSCRRYEIRDMIPPAEARAEAIRIIAKSMEGNGAQESSDPSSMLASVLALYNNIILDEQHGKNNTFQETSTLADSPLERLRRKSLAKGIEDIISREDVAKVIENTNISKEYVTKLLEKLFEEIMPLENIIKLIAEIISQENVIKMIKDFRGTSTSSLSKLLDDIFSQDNVTKLIEDTISREIEKIKG